MSTQRVALRIVRMRLTGWWWWWVLLNTQIEKKHLTSVRGKKKKERRAQGVDAFLEGFPFLWCLFCSPFLVERERRKQVVSAGLQRSNAAGGRKKPLPPEPPAWSVHRPSVLASSHLLRLCRVFYVPDPCPGAVFSVRHNNKHRHSVGRSEFARPSPWHGRPFEGTRVVRVSVQTR